MEHETHDPTRRSQTPRRRRQQHFFFKPVVVVRRMTTVGMLLLLLLCCNIITCAGKVLPPLANKYNNGAANDMSLTDGHFFAGDDKINTKSSPAGQLWHGDRVYELYVAGDAVSFDVAVRRARERRAPCRLASSRASGLLARRSNVPLVAHLAVVDTAAQQRAVSLLLAKSGAANAAAAGQFTRAWVGLTDAAKYTADATSTPTLRWVGGVVAGNAAVLQSATSIIEGMQRRAAKAAAAAAKAKPATGIANAAAGAGAGATAAVAVGRRVPAAGNRCVSVLSDDGGWTLEPCAATTTLTTAAATAPRAFIVEYSPSLVHTARYSLSAADVKEAVDRDSDAATAAAAAAAALAVLRGAIAGVAIGDALWTVTPPLLRIWFEYEYHCHRTSCTYCSVAKLVYNNKKRRKEKHFVVAHENARTHLIIDQ
jgi:hypothetical protein